MATNPAHVVDRALLQLEAGSMGDLIGRILTKIEACKDEVKMTGQNSFRLVRYYWYAYVPLYQVTTKSLPTHTSHYQLTTNPHNSLPTHY